MKRWLGAAFALGSLIPGILSYELEITDSPDDRQKCNGVYSKENWGGTVQPYVMTVFNNLSSEIGHDPIVSVLMFEWKDEGLIGKDDGSGTGEKEVICTETAVKKKLCTDKQLGEFILADGAAEKAVNPIITKALNLKQAPPINYEVKNTGYYCLWTYSFTADPYQGVVEFRNAYGELPAAQIPKLPFYGGLTIVYAVVGIFWAFLYVQNRSDILPVQNYITAIVIFLIAEQLITWGFYDNQNNHGNNFGNKALLIVTAILNAGRNSFSFFLLLIVCMGYGVVKESLGKTMTYVRILAGTHFVFGVIYGITSLTITPDSAGPMVLLVIVPLAGSLTVFYVWTLNSLSATMKDLLARKQSVKAMMYRRLWWCILGSILVIFGFFFFNSFTIASRTDPNFVPNNWKARWFILDGWLNLVYLFDICFVAYLWRPTANNRRFAMSDELAQDEEGGFEIASFGLSESDDEDEAGGSGRRANGGGAKPLAQHDDDDFDFDNDHEAIAPLANMPPKPLQDVRRSLDGETIFAVGDEDGDKFSSDEDEDHAKAGERERLTSGR